MTTEQQIQLIKNKISIADYNRARFLMRNIDTVGDVKKNFFNKYTDNELVGAACHIVTNYECPTYTFRKLASIMTDKQIKKLLAVAVPQWQRAVNAWFAKRNTIIRKMEQGK